jgi:hypothetical protein
MRQFSAIAKDVSLPHAAFAKMTFYYAKFLKCCDKWFSKEAKAWMWHDTRANIRVFLDGGGKAAKLWVESHASQHGRPAPGVWLLEKAIRREAGRK